VTPPPDSGALGPGPTPAGDRAVVAPYGSWPSPISAELVARGATTYDAVQITDTSVYWLEGRPAEDGRTVVVRWTPDGGALDLIPPGFSVGTRVHEYGGGAYLVAGTALLFANEDDQRLYRIAEGGRPEPITPVPSMPRALRHADARLTPDGRLLICVRERHEADAVVNELVALPPDGSAAPWPIAGGHDFYSFPRPSPDGRLLAWTTWDQPCMPWDGTDLWVAELDANGRLGAARHVAGGPSESIFQPEWSPDGVLHFVSDRSGWWNLYREQDGWVEPLAPMAAEFGEAQWELDYATYAFTSGGQIACIRREQALDHLCVLDPRTGQLEDLGLPYTSYKPYLRGVGGRLAFIAASPMQSPGVTLLDLASGHVQSLTTAASELDHGCLSTPRPIEFPARSGGMTYAFYYPPANRDARGPAGERPPLLVRPHEGPTTHAKNRLDLRVQLLTTRGIGVADVNYGGSTGYGRAYRERLTGQFGVVDVEDCIDAARYLIAQGDVDGDRVAIAGESAGGFTALSALVGHNTFTAGASAFGITDLLTFRRATHKFQQHELDRLVGPFPEAAELYRQRSPAYAVDRLSAPILLLQGLEDPVVPVDPAEAIVARLRRRGVPFAYLVFKEEGHGVRRPESHQRALEAELSFLSQVLGFQLADRIEPVRINVRDRRARLPSKEAW
jgi:dipeptidyl aminopeptidase/acylaminoacyl peptidase